MAEELTPQQQELADSAAIDEKEKIEKWRKVAQAARLDATKDYGEPLYTLSREGVGFFPKGDIHAIKAPQKNGKTFLISMLMGIYMKGGEYNGIKAEIENPKVIYIDTEQHPRNTAKVYRRSCFISDRDGWQNYQDLQFYTLRGKSPEEIESLLWFLIEDEKPDIVFLDGIVDMVNDPNDQDESKAVIRREMEKSMIHDCAIVNVLHVNPNSDKMRGHLGTILAQKACDVLCCLKDFDKGSGNATFTVEHTDARNKDIRQFAFIIEDKRDTAGHYVAVPCAPYISVKTVTTANDTMQLALDEGPLRFSDLVDKIVEIEKCSVATAKRRIKDATDSMVIAQDRVYKKYRYVGLDKPNEEELPF